MDATRAAQRLKVTVGDRHVAPLAGLYLLASLADRLGPTGGFSAAVPPAGEPAPVHDRGRLLVQVARQRNRTPSRSLIRQCGPRPGDRGWAAHGRSVPSVSNLASAARSASTTSDGRLSSRC